MGAIEAVARAVCVSGGYDPDERMPNDGPRWKYYVTGAEAALAAARPLIAAECAKCIEFNIVVGIRRRKETVKLPELLRLINGGAAIASIEATTIKETIR